MERLLAWRGICSIVRGKILANGVQFAKFFRANSYKCSEITEDLPADSPKFSSPFASSVMIRQNFLPPKFSHVRYLSPVIRKQVNARLEGSIHDTCMKRVYAQLT